MKGQGIYAYVTLMQDAEYTPELKKELVKTVRGHIGAFAAPDVIHWAPGQPSCVNDDVAKCAVKMHCEGSDGSDASTIALGPRAAMLWSVTTISPIGLVCAFAASDVMP